MEKVDVVIIGAGISGLRCAHTLVHEEKIKSLLVVDALDRIGGRICQDEDFIPGMILEVGAELVHGSNTCISRLAKENQWNMREIAVWAHGDGGPIEKPAPDGGVGYYYLGDQKRMLPFDSNDADFIHLKEIIEQLSENITMDVKQSLFDYFAICNLSPSMMKMAQASYANTLCGGIKEISWRMASKYEKQWHEIDGTTHFRLVPTFGKIIQHLQRGIDTRLNWAVQTIDYTNLDQIILTNTYGHQIACKRLVVTVPVTALSTKSITFVPSLPLQKLKAIETFGMRRAIKIHIQFKKRFWPTNTHGVICSDCDVPEFWISSNGSHGVGTLVTYGRRSPNEQEQQKEELYVITGFAGADAADALIKNYKNEKQIIEKFLEQLDRIYQSKISPRPASQSFVKGNFFDWSTVPYIHGAYSFPRVGHYDNARKDLAEPIGNHRIFFAGEATSFEQPGMTAHSAMDTGLRAAAQVKLSLRSQQQHSHM